MRNKLIFICCTLVFLAPSYADDLEVYTSSGTNAKVLFVLDASGSMLLTDDGQPASTFERTANSPGTRMATLNRALAAVVDEVDKNSKLEFGLTWFGGITASGIKLPMRGLNSPASSLPNVSVNDDLPGADIDFSELFLNTAKNIFPESEYAGSNIYDLPNAGLWDRITTDSFEINKVIACGETSTGFNGQTLDTLTKLKSAYIDAGSIGFADDNNPGAGTNDVPPSWREGQPGSWTAKNGDAVPATWIQKCPAVPSVCMPTIHLNPGTSLWGPSEQCQDASGALIKPFIGEFPVCRVGELVQVSACKSPFIDLLNDSVSLQTPTVDALFEATRYFRGENVFYGVRDKFPTFDQSRGRYFDELTSVSHGQHTIATGYPGNMEALTVIDRQIYSKFSPRDPANLSSGFLWGWRSVNPAALTDETRNETRKFISKNDWDANDAEHTLRNDVFKFYCKYSVVYGTWQFLDLSFHACNILDTTYTDLTVAAQDSSNTYADLRNMELGPTGSIPNTTGVYDGNFVGDEEENFRCKIEVDIGGRCNFDRDCDIDGGSASEDCLSYTEAECNALENGVWTPIRIEEKICDFRFESTQQYESPIEECSNSAIILISDGSPTSNTIDKGLAPVPDRSLNDFSFNDRFQNTAGMIRHMIDTENEVTNVAACAGVQSGDAVLDTFGACGPELAEFLATTPQIADNPKSTIKTHAIGFGVQGPPENFLKKLSQKGQGIYESASNQEDLVEAIRKMISTAETATAEAPALVINLASSNLKSSNVVYAPQFKASTRATWISNIKAYFLSPERDDENNVIESTRKYAVGGSRSLWSAEDTVTAGDDADEEGVEWEDRHEPSGLVERQIAHGGFNTNLVNGTHRDIYMECDTNCAALSYYKLNTNMPDLNAPPAQYYGLASGEGNTSTDQDEATADAISEWFATQPLGDSLHTKPVLVSYTGTFNIANIGNTENPKILYAVSNRGLLHAFDVTDVSNGYTGGNSGKFINSFEAPREIAAWLPAQLRRKVTQQYYSDGNDEFIYGLDGEIRIWKTRENNDDKTYLLLGMRRGGSAYYKFDISNPGQNFLQEPEWRIDQGFNYDDKWPYAELGQTWSPISVMKVLVSNGANGVGGKYVGVFGGGYDESDDVQGETRASTANQKGRGVYFIDMSTGRLLASIGSGDRFTYDTDVITTGVGAGMKWGVPSEIRVVDSNGDTYADRVYFGDMGGQLWQVEVGVITDTGGLKVTPTLLADLGSDDDPTKQRRFYEPPAVARLASGEIVVVAGSGYRAHPLNGVALDGDAQLYPVIEDALFVLKDRANFPLSESGFVDVLTATSAAPIDGSTPAWRLPLNRLGEKILSEPTVFSNRILFTSTRPTEGGDSCSISKTENRFYALKLFDGSASGDLLDPSKPDEREPIRDVVINSTNAIESEIAISVDSNKENCEPGKACGDFYVGVTDMGDYETVPGKVYWKETGKTNTDCRFDEDGSSGCN